MIQLHDIRYVRVGASNLDASVRFAQEIVGLELVGREPRMAWLRGDNRDHALCLTDGGPKQFSGGFELLTDATLEYSYGVTRIEDESNHVPRQFPFVNSSFCMWGAVPNIKEFKKWGSL